MPYVPNTPESLLPRSDSKNPAVTCHGLTSTGRSCRRAISITGTAKAFLLVNPTGIHGPEAYCWQHKDQVTLPSTSVSPQGSQNTEIRERTSIETLVERLGLLDIGHGQEVGQKAKRNKIGSSTLVESNSRPKLRKSTTYGRRSDADGKQTPQRSLATFLCCGIVEEESLGARPVALQHAKHSQTRARRPTKQRQDTRLPINQPKNPTSAGSLPSRQQGLNSRAPPIPESPVPSQRPSLSASPSSKTGQLLSLIPHTTSPQTSALLLAELVKPPSNFDEPGYIYIFWLTPDSLPSAPAQAAASTLLSPALSPSASHLRPPLNGRRTSSVLESFSVQSTSVSTSATTEIRATKAPKTILLKIGRASNVQRRLNEWSRQCGYNLSLVRYYPYQSTSPLPSASSQTPRLSNAPLKVPNVHKIERLIHLELAHKRAAANIWDGELNPSPSKKCSRCGAAHREWFEVEASRDGVKGVDELVRRWVDWGLNNDRYEEST